MAPQQNVVSFKVYKDGNIAVIEMIGNDIRQNPKFYQGFLKALDEVESWPDVKALVTTGSGRFYHNGLDLPYLRTLSKDEMDEFRQQSAKMKYRLLTFPMLTVAAINGHCFAEGLFFALSHDIRIMQQGRGWLCANEIDLNMRLTAYPLELFKAKLNPANLQKLLYGNRLVAKEALECQFIDAICPKGEALENAKTRARNATQNRTYTREHLQNMKRDLYRSLASTIVESKL